MISNDSVNKLLIAGRNLAEELDLRGKYAEAIAVIQLTSKQALSEMKYLPKAIKVKCRCGRILTNGREVEFYNNVGDCYSCDSSYSDSLDQ